MNNELHIDEESKNFLIYKNIIIKFVNNKTLDNERRQDIETDGVGTGYFIINRYFIHIVLEKDVYFQKLVINMKIVL